jgi:hypothetical protein
MKATTEARDMERIDPIGKENGNREQKTKPRFIRMMRKRLSQKSKKAF